MKRVCVAAAVLAALGGTASAAEPGFRIPSFEPMPVFSWTGVTLGLAAGAGATVTDLRFDLPVIDSTIGLDGIGSEGLLAAALIGADYQVSPGVVFGVLGDVHWSNIETTADASLGGGLVAAEAKLRAELGFDALARAGLVVHETNLIYALGGWSWQRFKGSGTVSVADAPPIVLSGSDTWNFDGWTAGLGFETLLSQVWAARLEYRFTQLREKTVFDFGGGNVVRAEPSLHRGLFAISYRFGGPTPAPSPFAY